MHYLDRANVIVLKTNRTYFVTPSVNSTCFLQFGQVKVSLSLSAIEHYVICNCSNLPILIIIPIVRNIDNQEKMKKK